MFKKKLLSFLILSVMALGMTVSFTGTARAQQSGIDQILNNDQLNTVAQDVYNENTGATPNRSIQSIIVTVINTILGLLGIIFLVIIIYAGFLWMTAGGNDDQVGKAKQLMTNSIIGIIIIVGAYAISYFVLNAVINNT